MKNDRYPSYPPPHIDIHCPYGPGSCHYDIHYPDPYGHGPGVSMPIPSQPQPIQPQPLYPYPSYPTPYSGGHAGHNH